LKRLIPMVLVLAMAPWTATPSFAQRLDGIAAVVNEDVVLQSDVEEQLYLFLSRAQTQPDSMTVDTLRREILERLIDEKLIVSEAKRQGITLTDAEIEAQVDDAIRDVKQRLGSETAFREQLIRENTTEAALRQKYREDVERQLLAAKLVQSKLPRRRVPPAEAEAYFKANRDKFPRVPAELQLQVIQIPALPDSSAVAAGRARAMEARRRIQSGEKFAKLAAELSDDPGTAHAGGDLGYFGRGVIDLPLEDEAYSLPIGELSDPVQSAYGWHILEVLDRDTLSNMAGKDSLDERGRKVVDVHARHILFRVPIDKADAERARKLSDRVRAEAMKGVDFGILARRYSKYAGPQGEGGDIGYVSLGALQPSIRQGLDTLEIGQISEVLTNSSGFNIFKVNDRKPEREYELDEIRAELPDVVAEMQQRERYETWVKELRAKAHIEIRS